MVTKDSPVSDEKVLPYAAEAEVPITMEQLNVLRKTFEAELPSPTEQATFDYAWGLVRSPRKDDIVTGVKMLQALQTRSSGAFLREILYYLAIAHVRLSQYTQAKGYVTQLLRVEPNNMQAKSLDRWIDQKVEQEGLVGMAIVGGIAAAGALVVGGIVRKLLR